MADDTTEWLILARRAGLLRAMDEHPADVEAAYASAQSALAGLASPTDPALEPWPPMRVVP